MDLGLQIKMFFASGSRDISGCHAAICTSLKFIGLALLNSMGGATIAGLPSTMLILMTVEFPEMVPQHNLDDPSEENWYSAFVVLFLAREENEEETSMFLLIPCKVISYNLLGRTC
ncbi:hypothetical protein EV1_022373 [Malus domestica]